MLSNAKATALAGLTAAIGIVVGLTISQASSTDVARYETDEQACLQIDIYREFASASSHEGKKFIQPIQLNVAPLAENKLGCGWIVGIATVEKPSDTTETLTEVTRVKKAWEIDLRTGVISPIVWDAIAS